MAKEVIIGKDECPYCGQLCDAVELVTLPGERRWKHRRGAKCKGRQYPTEREAQQAYRHPILFEPDEREAVIAKWRAAVQAE